MRELPILFSTPMVRAILEGRKAMTRRVSKAIPPYSEPFYVDAIEGEYGLTNFDMDGNVLSQSGPYKLPYKPGDRLWVRETFADNIPGCPNGITYRADHIDPKGDGPANPIKWKPSIHMPKAAARIWLDVVSVRVERLQGITYDDCLREGMWNYGTDIDTLAAFQELWQSLNAKRGYGWETNPWVWVVEFKRVKGGK